jgi:hypothetical protein
MSIVYEKILILKSIRIAQKVREKLPKKPTISSA